MKKLSIAEPQLCTFLRVINGTRSSRYPPKVPLDFYLVIFSLFNLPKINQNFDHYVQYQTHFTMTDAAQSFESKIRPFSNLIHLLLFLRRRKNQIQGKKF